MMPNQKYSVRQQAGGRVGVIGIGVNAVLFAAKFIMGMAENSVSVLADAFNNLTDCASSLAVFVGFKMCAKPADARHPNGHGRMEYICGFLVSLFMLGTALSFGKKAFIRIITPQAPEIKTVFLWIPLAAIVMKLCFALYTWITNKKTESAALNAIFKDSISDAALTGMTIFSLLLTPLIKLPLDGICSLLISGMILWSGITSFMEHLDLLLGSGESEKLKGQVTQMILSKTDIFCDVLSVTVFDYGPENQYALIQVSLNKSLRQDLLQDQVRIVIEDLKNSLNLEATIYWESKPGDAYEMLLPDNILNLHGI